jgi:hypothetical protein
MQKVRKPTPPMPRPAADEADLHSDQGPLIHRCPFCREGADADTSVVCRDCLTRHHAACWDEGGAKCSSCGGARRLEAEKLTLGKAVQLLEAQGYPAEEIKALLAPAVSAAPADRQQDNHLRRVMQAVLSMVVIMAVTMGMAGILIEGILELYGSEQKAALAIAFCFSSLIGLLVLGSGLKRR